MTIDRRSVFTVAIWAAFVVAAALVMLLVEPGMAHAQLDRAVSKAQNSLQSQLEDAWKIFAPVIILAACITRKPPAVMAAFAVAALTGLLVFGVDAFGTGVDRLARAWL